MGLDMYGLAVPMDRMIDPNAQVDLEFKDPDNLSRYELMYWRKYNHLHGWMHKLYTAKGGTDPMFNCNSVRLELEDLKQLKKELMALPSTDGFFFGRGGEAYAHHIKNTKKFIRDAKAAIRFGMCVYYTSWW
jgi:hypothetical protein